MKLLVPILLAAMLVLVTCGSEPPCIQYDLPLCDGSTATLAELADLHTVEAALLEVEGWVPCVCVFFVHDLEEARAVGLPQSRKPNRTDGIARGQCQCDRGVLVVRVYGDSAPYTMSLLIHEIGHAYGLEHGEEMQAWGKTIWGGLKYE